MPERPVDQAELEQLVQHLRTARNALTGWTAVVRENTGHHAFGGDLDGRAVLGVVTLDRRVVRGRRCAHRTEEQQECDADAAHPPTVAAAPRFVSDSDG